MSDTILGSNFTVAYLDENRQKRISWSGANDHDTESMNAVYSALMNLFDESAQSDDGVPMSAQTPTEYTVGLIDAGDTNDPWYITYDAMEHITGGALRTASWARVTSTNTGVVVVPATNVSMDVATDEGQTMTNGADTGTLLEIIDDGTDFYLVIRPTDNTATHDWDTGSGTITSSGAGAQTATQTAAALTGEQIWANFFSLGTIEGDTHIFGYYGDPYEPDDETGRARITSVNSSTEDWWGDGAIDTVVPIRDWTTAANPIIDAGFSTFKANKFSTEYSFFEVEASTTSGGRNPVPLSTKDDLNNDTGFRQVTLGTSALTWNEGEEILGATSGARAIITGTSGANPTITLQYYLLAQQPTAADHFGGALTDFNGSEAINNQDGDGTSASSGAPAAYGPSDATWFTSGVLPTIVYGNYQADIDNDATNEQYGILIDCNSNPLTEVYQWLKYENRYGEITSSGTGAGGTDVFGELWKGGEVYINYGTSAEAGGTIAEGEDVLQETSGATGIVVSHDTTSNVMLLRDVRGTFATGSATSHTITSLDAGAGSIEMDTADSAVAVAFAPNAVSPYGTFAGGTFFGARGVAIVDWVAADENSFQLTPIEGGTFARPQAFSITVTNLNGTAITDGLADLVAVFELSSDGGPINKTQYSSTGGTALAAGTQVVDTTITADTPAAGTIVVRDASDNNANYYIRYASYVTSTFTLAEFAAFTSTATTNTTQVTYATGGFNAAVRRGDLVWNVTRSLHSYVVSVDSDTQLTISPAIAGQTNADSIAINVMPIDDDTLDDVYVVPIHTYPTGTTASASVQYVDTYYYRAIVRNNRAATKIVPFTATGSVTSGTDNQTVQTVRNTDTITT